MHEEQTPEDIIAKYLPHHYSEKRPWGDFERFTHNELCTVKIITVAPGQAFSLQRHKNRDEFWKVLSGKGFITLGESHEEVVIHKNYAIPRGTLHRMESTTEPIIFLEVALGEFDENDIERLDDIYHRGNPTTVIEHEQTGHH
jgi:mannose-1-phosphate guanylyltransferase/mannose-1-phosphate guanylyltransferase/mannose-6-phosphate isomerase